MDLAVTECLTKGGWKGRRGMTYIEERAAADLADDVGPATAGSTIEEDQCPRSS